MRRILRLNLLWIGAALLAGNAGATTISTFDSGKQGWTGVGFADIDFPDFSSPLVLGGVVYHGKGGNGGGYISQQDPDGNWQYFSAPGAFLGDQSAAIGQYLTFDELIINNFGANALNPQGPLVAVTNGTLTLVYGGGNVPPPISGSDWNSLSVPLEASSWKVDDPDGATATTGQFTSVFSDLTGFFISSDFWRAAGDKGEKIGLDNVKLSTATYRMPEPSAWADWLGMLGVVVVLGRKTVRR
jgi:Laminin B (Domain IV)